MTKRRISGKRTMAELAQSIVSEGKLDNYKSSYCIRYYQAFGQHWRITLSRGGTIKSIEQVNENYERISL